jgi:hypothetical protein
MAQRFLDLARRSLHQKQVQSPHSYATGLTELTARDSGRHLEDAFSEYFEINGDVLGA